MFGNALLRDLHERSEERSTERRSRLQEIAKELASSEELRDSLALKAAAGMVPDDTERRQFESLDRKKAALELQRREWEQGQANGTALIEASLRLLSALPQIWRSASLLTQEKLQSFLFPNGVVVTKDCSFRKTDYRLLEQV